MQHLILSGVPGQALEMNVPSEEEHSDVAMQTPEALSLPVQGPSKTALSAMALLCARVTLKTAVAVKMGKYFIRNAVLFRKNRELLVVVFTA